jgi:hypothetical protein
MFYREMTHDRTGIRDRIYRGMRQFLSDNPLSVLRFSDYNCKHCLRTLNHNNTTVVVLFAERRVRTEEPPHQRIEPELTAPKVIEGKDELNLAEFPLSAIADRLQPDQKTLVFEDRILDVGRGEMITRQLTITASDHYGLPTAADDEVILGLVQLSKTQDFADRKVSFTRYQLIQLLGWGDEGKSYERLEKSLNRWVGVTLYYKNAWWSKDEKCWVDEKFHILDNVTLYDREKAHAAKGTRQSQLPLSTFTWNDVIFRSFRAGNLKSIDFDFLKSLDSAIAKRLYRFLDKRFFHRPRWEFNLKEVSWEHIGLSRNYDAANLKRALLPAIRELEQRGFLKAIPDQDRFYKIRSGEWRVVFERERPAQQVRSRDTNSDASSFVKALVERGVTPTTAEQTVASNPIERIKSQLEVFDWLVAQKDPKVSRNPAGFLVSSIKSEYAPPKAFLSREEHARHHEQLAERKRRAEERHKAQAHKEEAQLKAREDAIRGFWESLSDSERMHLETEALANATEVQIEVINRGGAFASATKQSLLDAYALRLMQQAA